MAGKGSKRGPVQVVAAVVIRDRKVLLVRTSKHGVGLPAGKVEPGETHVDALVREVLQETGLDVMAVGRCLGVESTHAYECHHYEVEVDHGAEPRPGSDALAAWWGETDEAVLPAFPMVHPMVLALLDEPGAVADWQGWPAGDGPPVPPRKPGDAVRMLSDEIQTLFGFLRHTDLCPIIPCECGMAHARSRAAALRTVMYDDLQMAAAVAAATALVERQLTEEVEHAARMRRVVESPEMAASSIPGGVLRVCLAARGWTSRPGTGEGAEVRLGGADHYTGPEGGVLWLWPGASLDFGTAVVIARIERRPVAFLLCDLVAAAEAAVPPPESGRLRSTRELVAWLAHAALESGGISEGEASRAMGLDRVDVRGVAIEGRDVAERLRAERMVRVRAEVARPAPAVAPTPLPGCGCCPRAGEYNGYGSDGPSLFFCTKPNGCPCHD